jgi:hypothetical protein
MTGKSVHLNLLSDILDDVRPVELEVGNGLPVIKYVETRPFTDAEIAKAFGLSYAETAS